MMKTIWRILGFIAFLLVATSCSAKSPSDKDLFQDDTLLVREVQPLETTQLAHVDYSSTDDTDLQKRPI